MKSRTQPEFLKPKTFRNRKKHGSKEMQREEQSKRANEAPHPRHQPYERQKPTPCEECGLFYCECDDDA